ncbi:MAG: hypothetical protein CSA49_03005 [Gammaproteobacteria bacterium]|nr:MAG: hypothetical protein CSA49_03005 [Gammaproteobacteria bacterium]
MNKKHLSKLILPIGVVALSGCNKPLWLAEIFSEQHENVYISDIALDDDNNTYSTGSVQTYFATDENNATIKGFDILTVKHDAEGNEVWRATYSSPYERTAPRQFIINDDGLVDIFDPEHWDYTGGEEGLFLLNDDQGNTYVVGRVHGENFDASQHVAAQDWDVVVLKYDTQGTLTAELILEDSDQFDAVRNASFENNQLSLAINDQNDSDFLVLNSDLSITQSHTLADTQVFNFVKTDTGKWVVAASSGNDWHLENSISLYDQNMTLEWSHVKPEYPYHRLLPEIALDSQNNIIVASISLYAESFDHPVTSAAQLEKFTPSGELEWEMIRTGAANTNENEYIIWYGDVDPLTPGNSHDLFNLKNKLVVASDDTLYWASEHLTAFIHGPLNLIAGQYGRYTASASTYIKKISSEGEELWQHHLSGSRTSTLFGLSFNTVDRRLSDIQLLPDDRLAVGYDKVSGTHFDNVESGALLGRLPYSRNSPFGFYDQFNYIEKTQNSRLLILQPNGEPHKSLSLKGEQQRAIAINNQNNIAVAGDNYDFYETLPLTWDPGNGVNNFFPGLLSLTKFESTRLRQDTPSKGSVALFSAE